jgi:hypothetical protein
VVPKEINLLKKIGEFNSHHMDQYCSCIYMKHTSGIPNNRWSPPPSIPCTNKQAVVSILLGGGRYVRPTPISRPQHHSAQKRCRQPRLDSRQNEGFPKVVLSELNDVESLPDSWWCVRSSLAAAMEVVALYFLLNLSLALSLTSRRDDARRPGFI